MPDASSERGAVAHCCAPLPGVSSVSYCLLPDACCLMPIA